MGVSLEKLFIDELGDLDVTGFNANEILHINPGATQVIGDTDFTWDGSLLNLEANNSGILFKGLWLIQEATDAERLAINSPSSASANLEINLAGGDFIANNSQPIFRSEVSSIQLTLHNLNNSDSADDLVVLAFRHDDSGGTDISMGNILFGTEQQFVFGNASTRDSYFRVTTLLNGAAWERLKIASDGTQTLTGVTNAITIDPDDVTKTLDISSGLMYIDDTWRWTDGGIHIDFSGATALHVENSGTKDDVFVVDTVNGRVGINKIPTVAFDVSGIQNFDNTGTWTGGDVILDAGKVSATNSTSVGDANRFDMTFTGTLTGGSKSANIYLTTIEADPSNFTITGFNSTIAYNATESTTGALLVGFQQRFSLAAQDEGPHLIDSIINASFRLDTLGSITDEMTITEYIGFSHSYANGGLQRVVITDCFGAKFENAPSRFFAIDNLYGIYIEKQTEATVLNIGLVLKGDGVGADIALGANHEDFITHIGSVPEAPVAGEPETGGSIDEGDHKYKVTFTIDGGNTVGGDESNTITTTATEQTSFITNITIGPAGTTSRKLWRTKVGDAVTFYLAATIADNTTVSESDDKADGDLGAEIGIGFGYPGGLKLAPSSGNPRVLIGDRTAGVDYELHFNGEDSQGVQRWLEDEDVWQFTNQDDIVSFKVDVSSANQTDLIISGRRNAGGTEYASFLFENTDSNPTGLETYIGASILSHNDGGLYDGDLRFATNPNGDTGEGGSVTPTERMRITSDGTTRTFAGRIVNETNKTGGGSIAITDDAVWGDTDGGAFALDIVTPTVGGERIRVRNTGTSGNALTVTTNGAETIDGGASLVLYDGETADLIYNLTDTNWEL